MSVQLTPAAAQAELAAGHLDTSAESPGQQEPSTEQSDFIAAGPAELPADLLGDTPFGDTACGDKTARYGGVGVPERQAQLPLSPSSPDSARDLLLALAEQIREAQTQPAFSFADVPPVGKPVQAGQAEPPEVSIATAPNRRSTDRM